MSAAGRGHDEKEQEIQERVAPPVEVVHEAIAREGAHELERSSRELAWSAVGPHAEFKPEVERRRG